MDPAGPEGAAHADLAAPLEHRDHHHVGDPDATDDEGDGAEGEQQVAQRLVGRGPGLERVGRPGHVDLVGGVGRIDGRASTSRTASTWSGTVRTYSVDGDVVVSNSSSATG